MTAKRTQSETKDIKLVHPCIKEKYQLPEYAAIDQSE